MPQFSQSLTRTIRAEHGVNPAVYDAIVKTMRYAALFRSFQEEHADDYRRFVDRLSRIKVRPAVDTPSVMIESE